LQNKNKKCQLSYSLFQTSQTGGQWYSDTSPFSIPWIGSNLLTDMIPALKKIASTKRNVSEGEKNVLWDCGPGDAHDDENFGANFKIFVVGADAEIGLVSMS